MSVLEALRSWRYAKAQPTAAVRRAQSCSAVKLVLTTGACMAAMARACPRRLRLTLTRYSRYGATNFATSVRRPGGGANRALVKLLAAGF